MLKYSIKVLLLILLCAITFTKVLAQSNAVCNGSFGDPVISETFGSGPNPGERLPAGYTNMTYVANCPGDGQYALVNSTNINNGATGCFSTWHTVLHDHTGDANGYMMLINASVTPSIFYTQPVNAGLCQQTTYEFSANVLNLLKLSASDNTTSQPNVKFTIRASDGTILQTQSDSVPPTASPEWQRFSMIFTMPANVNSIIIELSNQSHGGNGNDLLLDDIQFRACGPVIQTGFSSVTDNQPHNICNGNLQSYTLASALNNSVYNIVSRQWQRNNNDGNGWVDIPNQTNATLQVIFNANKPIGTYQYRLAVADGQNINSPECRIFSDPLTIMINPYPVVPNINPQQVCEGDALTLTASGGISYEWHGPGITAANKNQNPLIIDNITEAQAGNYNVAVTSAGNCTVQSNTFAVKVNTKPVITVTQPLPICQGTSTTLLAVAPTAVSYHWEPAAGLSNTEIANPIASPVTTTVYTVTASTINDCSTTATINLTVLPPPTVSAGEDKKIFEGQSVMLNGNATSADTYYWTPSAGLSNPNILTPIANPTDDVTYTLHVTSIYNCGAASSTVFVRVYKKIVIPNTFSPNGDGKNDFWDIEALVTYPQSLLTVFNRYGQQVFKSTGYNKPWKGTYNDAKLPPGTYYYLIDLRNGMPKLSGWVLLLASD